MNRPAPGCPDRGAFSLLELTLVLAIIAVTAAMAAPRYAASLARYRADGAAQRLVAELNLARAEARHRSESRTVIFDLTDDRMRIRRTAAAPSEPDERIVMLREEPYLAALTDAAFGGDASVVFNGYGLPDSGGAAMLSAGVESRTVVLDPITGEAEIQ